MFFKVAKEDWRKIGVYCITNIINGKIYIGSTTTNFRHRYLQYKSGFSRKLYNQPILYRAFRKYGFENFSFSVVCVTDKENTLLSEQFHIDKGTDYNACPKAGSLQGFKHPYNSKTRTVNKGEHHCAVKVDMYCLEGKFLKTFNSIIEAQEYSKIKSKSNITQCCKGKVFSAGGYKWSYHGNVLKNRVDKRTLAITEQKRINMSKPRQKSFVVNGVIAQNKETGEKNLLNSIKEASKKLNIHRSSIQNNVSGLSTYCKSKTTNKKYQFTWHTNIS